MRTEFDPCMRSEENPMYFNIREVPDEWRAEAQVLLTDRTIQGDGKSLMGMRKIDLLAAIHNRRLENMRMGPPERQA